MTNKITQAIQESEEVIDKYNHCKKWELEETTDFYLDASVEQIKAHLHQAQKNVVEAMMSEIDEKDIIHTQLAKEIVGSDDFHQGAILVLENLKTKLQETINKINK